jgi:hypothetical protein
MSLISRTIPFSSRHWLAQKFLKAMPSTNGMSSKELVLLDVELVEVELVELELELVDSDDPDESEELESELEELDESGPGPKLISIAEKISGL